MIKNLYANRDIKTGSFDSPFDSTNDETAIRYFTRVIDAVPLIKSHPEDFTLNRVGSYDNESATLIPLENGCDYLCSGLDCIKNIQESSEDAQQTSKVGDDSPVQSST